ncbi:MAG: hypothetical protein WED87_05770, partial [Dehalococcoidia bacterium]
MTCTVCRAALREDAAVCFNCETVLPGDKDALVAAIRDAAEEDEFARAADSGSSPKFDSTEHAYQAVEHANYKIHGLPWEHPVRSMRIRDYISHEIDWQLGFAAVIVLIVV